MPRAKPISRRDSKFDKIFWAVVLVTLACIVASYVASAQIPAAREALNEALLTSFKLGFGAIIALLGRSLR